MFPCLLLSSWVTLQNRHSFTPESPKTTWFFILWWQYWVWSQVGKRHAKNAYKIGYCQVPWEGCDLRSSPDLSKNHSHVRRSVLVKNELDLIVPIFLAYIFLLSYKVCKKWSFMFSTTLEKKWTASNIDSCVIKVAFTISQGCRSGNYVAVKE